MARFTTVADVVNALKFSDPEFAELFSDEQLADLVRQAHWSRYEAIDDNECREIVRAVYAACGMDDEDARKLAEAS